MSRRLSATLELSGGQVCCRRCQHPIVEADKPWKPRAALRVVSLNDERVITPAKLQIVLRQFSCPRCGALLDVETSLCDDPFLIDMVTS